jgi:hypothetical protein
MRTPFYLVAAAAAAFGAASFGGAAGRGTIPAVPARRWGAVPAVAAARRWGARAAPVVL